METYLSTVLRAHYIGSDCFSLGCPRVVCTYRCTYVCQYTAMQPGIGINNLFSKEGYVMASVRVFKVMIEKTSVRCFLPGVIHPLTSIERDLVRHQHQLTSLLLVEAFKAIDSFSHLNCPTRATTSSNNHQ